MHNKFERIYHVHKTLPSYVMLMVGLIWSVTTEYSVTRQYMYLCRIDENFVIKVSDFGLSEDIYARNYFRQGTLGEEEEVPVKLPVRWMAVESLNDGVFTEKTDVVNVTSCLNNSHTPYFFSPWPKSNTPGHTTNTQLLQTVQYCRLYNQNAF